MFDDNNNNNNNNVIKNYAMCLCRDEIPINYRGCGPNSLIVLYGGGA